MKAKKEQYNAILDKMDEILEAGIVEVRGLTEVENTEVEELRAEANALRSEIEEEIRSVEENATTKIVEEKEIVNMENTELEVRGMSDFIKGIDSEEVRAMSTAEASHGGIIPTSLDKNIIKKIEEVAPLFNMVPKFTPVAGTLDIPAEDEIGSAGFVGEGEATANSDFKFKTVQLTQKRAGSEITLNQHLINDSGIDIVDYSQNLLMERLGKALDRAMITGTVASKSFEGLKAGLPVANDYTGAFGIDLFIGAMASMKAEYQGGAKWVMNRAMFEKTVKMKDANGNLYVAREVINTGIQYKLFGLEILINDACIDTEFYLTNIARTFKGMIKKGSQLSKISEDTQNRRNGTVTLVLDTYVDAVIVQAEASLKIIPTAVVKSK